MEEIVRIDIKSLENNEGQMEAEGLPANPRYIEEEKFEKLVASVKERGDLLGFNPLKVYEYKKGKYITIGGNMRLRACREAGYDSLPCIVIPKKTSVDDLRAMVVLDNSAFGKWDWDMLANDWEMEDLEDWGIDLPNDMRMEDMEDFLKGDEEGEKEEDEERSLIERMLDDRIFSSDNEFEIPCLKKELQADEGVILPFQSYGAESRSKQGIGTYHFYTDDYRFEGIWKHPEKVIESGCKCVVEPNLSLYDTTPIAYGLHLIYKKRWIARYFQECGKRVYADLNVSEKFAEYNALGIPQGWNAFATRGYDERIEQLERELERARRISGKEVPNMVVYGGGGKVKEFCRRESLTYIEQYMKAERKM